MGFIITNREDFEKMISELTQTTQKIGIQYGLFNLEEQFVVFTSIFHQTLFLINMTIFYLGITNYFLTT